MCAITRDYLEQPELGSSARVADRRHRRPRRRLEADRRRSGPPVPGGGHVGARPGGHRAGGAGRPEHGGRALPGADQPTFGWAAGDASYAMGSFELAEDEALVIEGRSPECAFWNVLPLERAAAHLQLRLRGRGHGRHEPGHRSTAPRPPTSPTGRGGWSSASAIPGVPNWLWTQGHRHGLIWFRWFLPDVTPDRPTTRVVQGRRPVVDLRYCRSSTVASGEQRGG